jgi:mannose-6-phosphate isomerase-like protein (cupin superfamily)
MGHPATSDRQEREFVWGQLLRATILTTAAETDGRHDLIEASTPPGEQTPLHLHTRYDERLWVISGSLRVWAGPDKVTLRSGDYYAIPMNTDERHLRASHRDPPPRTAGPGLDPRRTPFGPGAPRVRDPLQPPQAASVPAAAATGH